jgi:sugar phosphate isomerase/epimerase
MFLWFIDIKGLSMTPEEFAKDFKSHGFSYFELLVADSEDPEALRESYKDFKDVDGWSEGD